MRSRIKQTRKRIEALRRALLSPAAGDVASALAGLDDAVRSLQDVEREMLAGAGPSDDIRRELKLVKNDLRISARLIAHGMAFCEGWARLVGAGPSYNSAGQTAPVASQGSLMLRG